MPGITKYGYPDDFLDVISRIESSGGRNIKHPTVQAGIQAGTAAIGKYGLMPNTIKEYINRRRLEDSMTLQLKDIDSMNPAQMKAYIESNPQVEDELAKGLATQVLRKQLGDEDRAAYSWHQGHNLSPKDISDQDLNDSASIGGQYVNKYRNIKNTINKEKENQPTSGVGFGDVKEAEAQSETPDNTDKNEDTSSPYDMYTGYADGGVIDIPPKTAIPQNIMAPPMNPSQMQLNALQKLRGF